ncbi:MAG: LamG domain-containing protein [Planctomycetota bacterium]|nr:LamG domain-containing protein [Planctomycetota bacterium]MDA1211776.1 LamG domain-containing protein [Planctomycetota bacterium]
MFRHILGMTLISAALAATASFADEPKLIGQWKLQDSAADSSGSGLTGKPTGVKFVAGGPTKKVTKSAQFDGRDDVIEIESSDTLNLGKDPFSVSLWVHTDEELDDVLGDLISRYDADSRKGFSLTLMHNVGQTTGQANYRQLQFGIDDGHLDDEWTDHGRLGDAVLVYSMLVHDGVLYASTCEAEASGRGHVFRFEGGDQWTDIGSPDPSNSISCLATYNGEIYAAASKYRLKGSALSESENENLGGTVYKYVADNDWEIVGKLPDVEAFAGLVVYKGKLYASSLYKPPGLFRYEGGTEWTSVGTPEEKRVEALTVWNGEIFASCYDQGAVFRYDGERWINTGVLGESTQTYAFVVYQGELYCGCWRGGDVYRYDGDNNWVDVGQLDEELEVMGMAVYNGKMYAGTLPLAQVYRFDKPGEWTLTGRIDMTPDVMYRRTWTMATYQGRLFAGTLPSGRVWSIEAGRVASADREFPSGWHHVAAVKENNSLKLYVDGACVSESSEFSTDDFELNPDVPLKIGCGPHDFFKGKLADVRLYRGILSDDDVSELAK